MTGSRVFHRQIGADLPVAVGGEGVFILAEDGRRFLDASGGAAVSCLGHSDASVIKAIQDQAAAIPFAHTGFFTSQPAEALADRLVDAAPGELNHVYYLSGGSEANEAALKLVRQYFVEKGEPSRRHFIARRQSYHGNTLGALAIGGNAGRRAIYEPLLASWSHVSPCYPYRHQTDGEGEDAYVARLADELEQEILRVGPENVAAFLAEPVVGASLGAQPSVPGYFPAIRRVLDKYGVLLVLDEVMCGMGRTGTMFACEQDNVVPDIVTCAKGLGAGYQPIGAMIVSDVIYNTVAEGSGAFQHGHTYLGHPVACAAALAVQKRLTDDGLLARVMPMGEALEKALHDRFGNHPNVGNLRGRGLFRGLELVQDRAGKTPFDPSAGLAARIKKQALARELICYPGTGAVDGKVGDHVLLAPPYIVDEQDIAEIVDRLGAAIDAALAEVNR